ncbi:hypothetical protein ACKTSN_19855 [Streptomyces flavusporus]
MAADADYGKDPALRAFLHENAVPYVLSSVHRENCRSGGLVCARPGVLGLFGGGCPW